jgi:hypothetical protein
MEKLVAAGTDTEKDLAAERTSLIQFEIQGRAPRLAAFDRFLFASPAGHSYFRCLCRNDRADPDSGLNLPSCCFCRLDGCSAFRLPAVCGETS